MNQRSYKLEYIERQLSEVQLIQYSLLPDEHLTLLGSDWDHNLDDNDHDSEFWKRAFESCAEYELPAFLESIDLDIAAASPVWFEIKVDGANIWFRVSLPPAKPSGLSQGDGPSEPEVSVDRRQVPTISVKGENITRAEQEYWQDLIVEKTKEIDGSEYVPFFLFLLIVQSI